MEEVHPLSLSYDDGMATRWRYLVVWKTHGGGNWNTASEPHYQAQLEGTEALYVLLSQLGEDGWELISGQPMEGYIFKRPATWTVGRADQTEVDAEKS